MRIAVSFLVGPVLLAAALLGPAAPAAAAPEGQLTWATHFSLAPTWFDPAETSGIITPFVVLYALHDAMVKPLPGNHMAPSLAESWTASPDGLTIDFTLRKGLRFHNGDPVTSEDVKFSFERYRGASNRLFKERVAAVETPDATRVRFRLKDAWPDFMTFYSVATGAGWVVPKKYVERVGDDGFKKAPVGAGPYRFVSFTPGVELVLEAFEGHWRKVPSVKRVVLRSVPDDTTRLAALKRGEVDIAYAFWGALAEEARRSPGLNLKATVVPTPFWLHFVEQWDAKSPWHDRRVRLAANLALDRQAINQAENLGFARITNSIIPYTFDFFWQPPIYPHDVARAKALLAEAGFPNGLDGGDMPCDAAFTNIAEAAANSLRAAGIRLKLRPLERAAFFKEYGEKKLRGVILSGSGAPGNAPVRMEAYAITGGRYVYGAHPEVDGLYKDQANEMNVRVRQQLAHKMQQIIAERWTFAPVIEPAFINGVGPRLEVHGLGLIGNHAYSAPYEDLRLKR